MVFILQIYEPVKTICEAFGFQNSLSNNISQEGNQDEIPNQMKNVKQNHIAWKCHPK